MLWCTVVIKTMLCFGLLQNSANCWIKYNSLSGSFLLAYSRNFPNSSTKIKSILLGFLKLWYLLNNSERTSSCLLSLFLISRKSENVLIIELLDPIIFIKSKVVSELKFA